MNWRELRDEIIRDEGWRAHAYQDTLGFWTIGYGFLIDARRGDGLPKNVADLWLDQNLIELAKGLDKRIPWWRNQPESVQRALMSMAYQLGINGLMNFKKMIAALDRGDQVEAARQALDSRWATQTPNRAKRIAALLRSDED